MLNMAKQHIQDQKPSNDSEFEGRVPFFTALNTNDVDALQSALNKNPALINVVTRWDTTTMGHYWSLGVAALHIAAGMGNEAMVDILMDAGADVNGRRGEGQAPMVSTAITPLHEAVKMQNTDMAERLITHSADVNAENAGGQTPLYYAVYRHDPQMIDLLIQHGADIHHKDEDGRTAADWAVARRDRALVDLLVGHGVKQPKLSAFPSQRKEAEKTVVPRRVPTGTPVLGRILDHTGMPEDGGEALLKTSGHAVHTWTEVPSPIWQTGIKIIIWYRT